MALTVRDHMALQLATRHYKYAAVRDAQVRELLGWSASIFWRRVNALIDEPAALEAYPADVRRLQRLRDRRRQARAS